MADEGYLVGSEAKAVSTVAVWAAMAAIFIWAPITAAGSGPAMIAYFMLPATALAATAMIWSAKFSKVPDEEKRQA